MNSRQRKLIELLSNEPKTVSYYAKVLNVSERTIHNDLNFITPLLIEMGKKLIKKRGTGVYIVQGDDKAINLSDFNVSLTIEERQFLIFKELLFGKESISLEYLSNKYYVSISSIRNDLKQIEIDYLNEDTLILHRDIDGTYLTGDEEALLKTHIKFCQHIYMRSEENVLGKGFYETFRELYTIEVVDTCLEVIEEVERENITFMGEYYRTSLLILLIVLTHRVKTSILSDSFISGLKRVDNETETLEFSKSLLQSISIKLNINFYEDDCLFLNTHIKGLRINLQESGEVSKFEPTVKKILKSIRLNLGIDVSSDDLIEQQLIVHINSMLYRINNNIAIKNTLTREIKSEYFPLFNSLWIVLNEELKEYLKGKKITEDEVAFIVIYLQTILNMQRKYKRVLVVCPNGISTSQLLYNKLKLVLPPMEIIEAKSIKEAENMDLSIFDFIISTTSHTFSHDNVIQISPLFTNHDVRKITGFYNQKILIEDQESVEYFPTISKLVNINTIFIENEKSNKSKNEIIYTIHKKLKELNYVEAEYYDSVMEREKLGSTEVGNNAAVPHGSPKYVKQSVLGIYIFKETFKWDENNIKIVLMPCIKQNDIFQLKELFHEILGLLGNKKIFNKLTKLYNKREILNLLEGVDYD